VGLKGEWDALTTFNQFVASFVHPCRSKMAEVLIEIEQWIAQGWLMGHETFSELQDMATMTDLIYQEAAQSADVQAEIFGIKGRFQEVLAPLMPRGAPCTILEALTPILEEHPGMWPGMALYWLRRQSAAYANSIASVGATMQVPLRRRRALRLRYRLAPASQHCRRSGAGCPIVRYELPH